MRSQQSAMRLWRSNASRRVTPEFPSVRAMLTEGSPNWSGRENLHSVKSYGHPLGVTCARLRPPRRGSVA
jgi:hypothetical protein